MKLLEKYFRIIIIDALGTITKYFPKGLALKNFLGIPKKSKISRISPKKRQQKKLLIEILSAVSLELKDVELRKEKKRLSRNFHGKIEIKSDKFFLV